MKTFLKKSLLFLAILVAGAYLLQGIIDFGLKKSNFSIENKEWYNLMNSKINSDIIIQGSSRARFHISPSHLEKQFGLSAYNLGISGAGFPTQQYRLSQYLKHNKKPKYIIQQVDNILFGYGSYDPVQYVPYLNQEVLNVFKGRTIFTKWDIYIPLYKYSHVVGTAGTGLTSIFHSGAKENGNVKGFRTYMHPYNRKLLDTLSVRNPKGVNPVISVTAYAKFIDFIKYCKQQNIKLILVFTPSYIGYQNILVDKNAASNRFLNLSKMYNVPYLDYTKDPICLDTANFFDYYHMNTRGAEAFNKKLVVDLKPFVH